MEESGAYAARREQKGLEAYFRGLGNSGVDWLWLYYHRLIVTDSFRQPITAVDGYKEAGDIFAFRDASAMDGIDSLHGRAPV